MAVRTQNTRQCRRCKAPVAMSATACDFCGAYLTEVATGGSRREAIVLAFAGVLTLATFGGILVPLGRVERETRRARQAAWALEHPTASPEPEASTPPEPETSPPLVASPEPVASRAPSPAPSSAPSSAPISWPTPGPTPGRLLGPGVNRGAETDPKLLTLTTPDLAPESSRTTTSSPDVFAPVSSLTETSPPATPSPEPKPAPEEPTPVAVATPAPVASPTPIAVATPAPEPSPTPIAVATPAPVASPTPVAVASPVPAPTIADLALDARVWDGHQWERTLPGHHHNAICGHFFVDGRWQLFAVVPRLYDGPLQDYNLKRPDQGLYLFHGSAYWLRDHVHDANCVHQYGIDGWYLPEAR